MHSDRTSNAEKRDFGIADKLSYAAGDFGCNMSFALKGTVQTFWLVYMMLETQLLSLLLLVVQIWDAVNDPLIGAMIDNDQRVYKHGKYKTYIFIGACGLMIAGALIFIPVPNANILLKAVIFVVGYIIWDACYTIANVPYGSMLSLITDVSHERAQLSGWRSIGSAVGSTIPAVILPLLIWKKAYYDGSGTQHIDPITSLPYKIGDPIINPLTGKQVEILIGHRVFWVALVMGILGFAAFMFMLKNITLRHEKKLLQTSKKRQSASVFSSFGNFIKNRAALGATLAAMGAFIGVQSGATASTVMFATYFGMASLSGIFSLIGIIPMFVLLPFIRTIVERFGKKEAASFGSVISLIGATVMLFFPQTSNITLSFILYLTGSLIFGIGMGFYTCVSWAMMGDAIDYNRWIFKTSNEGTIYALHSFFRKLAQGIGPSVVLLIMGALGYVSKLGTVGQSPNTAKNMCFLVAFLYMFSAVTQFVSVTFIYNIDKKTLSRMKAELNAENTISVP